MATRQSASKSARPVAASPTSKPSASKPQRAKPTPAPKPPAEANGATARKEVPRPQAIARYRPDADASLASDVRFVRSATASALRAVADGCASALRAVVSWSGGGLPFATLLFSVLGFADSVYLTVQHFTTSSSFLGCSEKGAINCEAVTTSAWSHLPAGTTGIPVSVAGLAFFVFMLAINSRWGWRAPWAAVHWARLASVVVGILLVLYLVWAELFRINAICLYCTGVHIITFILFVLIISRVVMSGVQGTGTTDNG